MQLPADYFHAFLGNGVDAVLIGYTGSMVPDRIAGPDRCCWYKADRYYPQDIPVLPAEVRRILLGPAFRPAPGQPWYELAPLARCWYEAAAPPLTSRQAFDPRTGLLQSVVAYPGRRLEITTFLHAEAPVLVERYRVEGPGPLRLLCAPGVWVSADDEPDPVRGVQITEGVAPVCRYRVGANEMALAMLVHPEPVRWGTDGRTMWLEVEAPAVTRYVVLVDAREERLPAGGLDAALARIMDRIRAGGVEDLLRSHRAAWETHHAEGAQIDIPHPALARVYAQTGYQLKAIQHPVTGAIPVNTLRGTWSSHIFWDAGFMHLALLQMGHTVDAGKGCGFLERLRPAAAESARAYGAQGLKYEWEITHDGSPAYGAHDHMVHQLHNNAMYSAMCWNQYRQVGDEATLRWLYPIVKGVAEFFLTGVIRPGPTVRAVTGIGELPDPVAVDAATLAGIIGGLRLAGAAARRLDRDAEFGAACEVTAAGLLALLSTLIRDGILYATDRGELSWGLLPACALLEALRPGDPVILRTVRAFVASNANPHHGIVGHGVGPRGPRDGFPWAAGWAAAVLAAAGAGEDAWRILQTLPLAVSCFGGMPEKVFDDGTWNMQYFTTAQAAVCLALHALIAFRENRTVRLSAPPWPGGTFRNLHVDGLALSGAWEGPRIVRCVVRNAAAVPVRRTIAVGEIHREVELRSGEELALR